MGLSGKDLVEGYNRAMCCSRCGRTIIPNITGMKKTDDGLLCQKCDESKQGWREKPDASGKAPRHKAVATRNKTKNISTRPMCPDRPTPITTPELKQMYADYGHKTGHDFDNWKDMFLGRYGSQYVLVDESKDTLPTENEVRQLFNEIMKATDSDREDSDFYRHEPRHIKMFGYDGYHLSFRNWEIKIGGQDDIDANDSKKEGELIAIAERMAKARFPNLKIGNIRSEKGYWGITLYPMN